MFLCTKKWSSAKLSLNRDLSLNKVLLNRECTVVVLSKSPFIYDFIQTWFYCKPFRFPVTVLLSMPLNELITLVVRRMAIFLNFSNRHNFGLVNKTLQRFADFSAFDKFLVGQFHKNLVSDIWKSCENVFHDIFATCKITHSVLVEWIWIKSSKLEEIYNKTQVYYYLY